MKTLLRSLIIAALIAILVLAGLLVWPVGEKPLPFGSITDPFANVDYSTMPAVQFADARDGVGIAYRHYDTNDARAVALLLHGSTADSQSMHPMAKALAATGVAVYTIDIRGHGETGLRGDVDHIDQPSEDVADMLGFIHEANKRLPATLIGFSSGGGLALIAAGKGYAPMIEKLILVSPMLGVNAAPSTVDNPNAPAESWAHPDIPRLIGLTILNRLGVHSFDYLPVIVFAAGNSPHLTPVYSHRLLASMNPQDADVLLKGVDVPITLLAGDKDEVFASQSYAETVHASVANANVELLPGIGHVGMTLEPAALAAIAAEIPRSKVLAQN